MGKWAYTTWKKGMNGTSGMTVIVFLLTVSTLCWICSQIKNSGRSAQGKLNMKWSNLISSIKGKIRINSALQYRCCNTWIQRRKNTFCLQEHSLFPSVHISLAKCSKIWIMYLKKNHKKYFWWHFYDVNLWNCFCHRIPMLFSLYVIQRGLEFTSQ